MDEGNIEVDGGAAIPVALIDFVAERIANQLIDVYVGGFTSNEEEQMAAADKFSNILRGLNSMMMGSVVIEMCGIILALGEELKSVKGHDGDV